MSKQTKGLKRDTIDKYYTKPSIVNQCIDLIKSHINIQPDELIIEPSAGNGSFISLIKTLSTEHKFYDIKPEHPDIIKQDFLVLDHEGLKKEHDMIHIIGNPPFGRQASLAIKFIKKCCLFANSISFILPKSFKKDSMQKYFSENYHLIYETDLAANSFLVNNVDSDVPCVFQIWQLDSNKIRVQKQKEIPVNFMFVSKNKAPDIAFRRVGVYAGKIMKEYANCSVQSHYYIKFLNNKTSDQNILLLQNIKFDHDNTVGPKSISKQELIREFNKFII